MASRYYIPLLFLIFSCSPILAQKKTFRNQGKQKMLELFVKTQKVYESNNVFKFNTSYKLFASYTSSRVTEAYQGLLVKNGRDFYSKIGQTEFLRSGGDFIKIDNESQLILIDNTDNGAEINDVYNLDKLVSNFESFELDSDENYWICTLTAPSITFVPYGKVVIYINKKDHTISKQVIYMLKTSSYREGNGKVKTGFPRLEITFSGFTARKIGSKTIFNRDMYVKQVNRKYIPAGKYAKYKIVE